MSDFSYIFPPVWNFIPILFWDSISTYLHFTINAFTGFKVWSTKLKCTPTYLEDVFLNLFHKTLKLVSHYQRLRVVQFYRIIFIISFHCYLPIIWIWWKHLYYHDYPFVTSSFLLCQNCNGAVILCYFFFYFAAHSPLIYLVTSLFQVNPDGAFLTRYIDFLFFLMKWSIFK